MYKHGRHLDVPYIEDLEGFLQHLMAMFEYLVTYPNVGDYNDNVDGHIVLFDDIEVIFLSPDI